MLNWFKKKASNLFKRFENLFPIVKLKMIHYRSVQRVENHRQMSL
jgi:hypothetical protein